MDIAGETLAGYLPHQGRMSLLTRVVQYDLETGSLAAEVDVGEADLFFDGERGGVPSWVGFEYMAQSIAALSGLKRRIDLKEEPRIGFVLGVRGFSSRVPVFAAGRRLRVEVRQIFKDGNLLSFEGSIAEGQTEQARGIINVIEVDEELTALMGGRDG